jgi:hypothetical protein
VRWERGGGRAVSWDEGARWAYHTGVREAFPARLMADFGGVSVRRYGHLAELYLAKFMSCSIVLLQTACHSGICCSMGYHYRTLVILHVCFSSSLCK